MPRVISDDQLNGAEVIKRSYEPPPKPKAAEKKDEALKLVTQLIERLPGMIASASRAPVVNVEAPRAPDVKVSSPSVYLTTPEIKVPATTVNVPDGKAPVVNVEPPDVHLTINRPKKWKFDISRDEYGRMTTITAEAI
jgi:hypothetical protein